jgi:tetratricopeptide (TPR) repeat protein
MLAAGAVLSQDFTFELLCAVAGLQEGAGLRAMDELVRGQLLREFASRQVLSYVFTHDKIRDVVYTEAGEARRRVFHRRALAALEESGTQARSVTRLGKLARHAQAAGEWSMAFRYRVLAGDESLALFAAHNAIAHYEEARALLAGLQPPEEMLRRLHVNLGRAYELAGDYALALSVYSALQALARERDNKPLELVALMARTTIYAAPTTYYDPDHVKVLTEQALPLARKLADHNAEAKIQWNLMLLKLFTGKIDDAVAAGEASLAIARKHGLSEREAYALHDLTRAYLFSGRAEDGLDAADQAQALWRELHNKAMLADNLVTGASARLFWQGADEALILHLHEALAVSQEIDNLWNQSYANHVLGNIYPDLGYYGRAIEACERSIELGKESGFMVPLFVNGSILAWLYALMGHPRRGFSWVQQGLQADTGMRDQQSGPLAAKAYLHMCLGDLDKADDLIRQSYEDLELHALSAAALFTFPMDGHIRLARQEHAQALEASERLMGYLRQTRMKLFRADALFIKAQAFLGLGRIDEGREALAAAHNEAQARNTRRILWEILALQARLAGEDGQSEKALALRKQAREIVGFIAVHIDDDALREGFLENSGDI